MLCPLERGVIMELIKGLTLVDMTNSLTPLGGIVLIMATVILDVVGFILLRLKNKLSLAVFVSVIILIICSMSGKISIPYLTETIYKVKADSKVTMEALSEKYEILRTENGEYVIKQKSNT